MKKTLLLSSLAFTLLLPALTFGQRTVVRASPLKLLFRTFSISAEQLVRDNQSAALHMRYSFFARGNKDEDGGRVSCTGIGFTPEYRFYLLKNQEAPRGLYAAPYALTNFYKLKYEVITEAHGGGEGSVGAKMFGVGGIAGYQFITKNNIAIDMFLGLGFQAATSGKVRVRYEDSFEEKISTGLAIAGILPRFGFSVGYAF